MIAMRLRRLCLVSALLASWLTGCGDAARQNATNPITIFAASSLRETVEEIAREWSKRSGQVCVTRFEASSVLARQIAQGAHCDLLLTADPEWLDALQLLQRRDWLGNRLVLVAVQDQPDLDISRLKSLALANEQVPAGKYAKSALRTMHITLPERVIYGSNVRDVLAKVANGGAQAGIVYATDAAMEPAVRVAFAFAPDSHPPIRYAAGLLTEHARGVYAALFEAWAMERAVKRGFVELQP